MTDREFTKIFTTKFTRKVYQKRRRKRLSNNDLHSRRGDRAAEGAALEMLCGRKFTAGSNPALSVFNPAIVIVRPSK